MSESTDNYLKAILALSQKAGQVVNTNALAEKMNSKASSVTDMLTKLSEKGLVNYTRYKGATLTREGYRTAIQIVRKHRLWEVFLVNKLHFSWDKVHDIAEQLEHIDSDELTNRLEEFLDFPRFDPHGDPIPDRKGHLPKTPKLKPLFEVAEGSEVTLVAVDDSSNEFLNHLKKLNIQLGMKMTVIRKFDFDESVEIMMGKKKISLSQKSVQNMLIEQD